MDGTQTLGSVHEDMARYLANDCYCPNEIYGLDGFFYRLFPPDSPCRIVTQNDDMTVVIAWQGEADEKPQAIMFWHDDKDNPGRIIGAQRVDATKNNVEILSAIANGEKTDGRKIDEYEPGSTKESIEKVLSISDAVMID